MPDLTFDDLPPMPPPDLGWTNTDIVRLMDAVYASRHTQARRAAAAMRSRAFGEHWGDGATLPEIRHGTPWRTDGDWYGTPVVWSTWWDCHTWNAEPYTIPKED